MNNHTYIVCELVGPIRIEEILSSDLKTLKKKYPKTKFRDKLKQSGTRISLTYTYTKQDVILAIQDYYALHLKIPEYRDFDNPNNNYPTTPVVKKIFGTWNDAIKQAGFKPNIQNGFGLNTLGLDGVIYRSSAESYFANTFLYEKYEYLVEPKYPKPYNRYYDWYLTDEDVYIELDGGIRPLVIKEKKMINRFLNRNLLIINTNSIYSQAFSLKDLIEEIRASKVAGTAC